MATPTIRLSDLQGIWRPVYTRRQALHATADQIVLAAWKADLAGIDLSPAIAAWRAAVGEALTPAQKHRREAATAAVLALLSARDWARTRAALALAARRAHRAGYAAGHALTNQGTDDDSDYGDPPEFNVGSTDMGDHAAQATAAATLAAILTTTARRAGRHIADATNDDPEDGAQQAVDDSYDTRLATDTAISAAYGLGLLAAYIAAGRTSVALITAGDERVCETCMAAETGSPYALLDAPRIPLHPRCRCVLAPI